VALAADIARSANFTVVDLGASVPPDDLARAASNVDDLVAVGICASAPGLEPAVRRAIQAVRSAVPAVPVLVGGSGLDAARARRLPADGIGTDAPALVGMLDRLRPTGAPASTPSPSG
jgi:methylmalonyl-CoA mutase cobalamin-binding subunit